MKSLFLSIFVSLGLFVQAQDSCLVKIQFIGEHGLGIDNLKFKVGGKDYSTEKNGKSQFKIPYGSTTIEVFDPEYKSHWETIEANSPSIKKKVGLEFSALVLDTYEFKTNKSSSSYFRMKAIEGTTITQGKKSEVISLDNVVANKATNSSRQIYAKIPGLNIWESDGAGVQLGIGGRGLSPSRTANFNSRQNGYDISADALGYPETYYTPTSEAIDRIQLIRGAASLQFGTQFGGLLNFVTKLGGPTPFGVTARQTVGSFGLSNSFLSAQGSHKVWDYYVYGNYKFGKDFRPNSSFNVYSSGINLRRHITENSNIQFEFTKMNYLMQQPGGLTDAQFELDPTVSIRARNWFRVDWNLAAINYNLELEKGARFNARTFGLIASREALGYLDQINRIDHLEERNLISGKFRNYGAEARFIKPYEVKEQLWSLLLGGRAYKGFSIGQQGLASDGYDANFTYINPNETDGSRYKFPSSNYALFAENIIQVTDLFSITPGLRYEWINTSAIGEYRNQVFDLAGNLVFDTLLSESRNNNRNFLISGIGANFKMSDSLELYTNLSQNYRSINFTDMQIVNPNFRIDPNLEDEKGFNFDIGLRGSVSNKFNYDVSGFLLHYNNRIGTTIQTDSAWFTTYQYRTNISQSITKGVEAMVDLDLYKIFICDTNTTGIKWFTNVSFIDATYVNSVEPAYEGKKVELVPPFNLKTGLSLQLNKFAASYQFSFTKEHFSDATNSLHQANAVNGLIPSYYISDLNFRYDIKKIRIEAGINNLTNESYFTRRATAYPGPGIIPAQPRNLYFTLQIKL